MEAHRFWCGVSSQSTFLLLTNKPLRGQYHHHHHHHLFFLTLPTGHNSRNHPLLKTTHISAASNTGSSPETDQDGPLAADIEAEPVGGIRFRRGTRRRARLEQEGGGTAAPKARSAPKDWDSMTINEKLAELYVGEKGLLFWLNKFAYASIFIVIGGWILFRFVGPSVGLYQLDGSPLAPSDLFKGSSSSP